MLFSQLLRQDYPQTSAGQYPSLVPRFCCYYALHLPVCRVLPRELTGGAGGADLDVSVEDKRAEDFVAPPYRAFSGETGVVLCDGASTNGGMHGNVRVSVWRLRHRVRRFPPPFPVCPALRDTGAGEKMGSAAPAPSGAVVKAGTGGPAPAAVDPAAPTTTLAVRLLDGRREKVVMNLSHTVADLQARVLS